MIFPRFLLLLTVLLSISAFSLAQTESPTESQTEKDEAKEKLEKQAIRLAEQAVGEASSLKLWENRALAYAMAGDLIWKSDQKRAKALFRDSADELINGAIQPKKKSNSYFDDSFFYWLDRSPRRVILLMLASHDADMALKLLLETRPPSLQQAIDEKNRPKVKGQKKTTAQIRKDQSNTFRVNRELGLEQLFASKAAEQDPEKAAKLIRDSLKKGISMSAITSLQKVYKKDEDLGKDLLSEIVDKVLSEKISENAGFGVNAGIQVISYLIGQTMRPSRYKSSNKEFVKLDIAESDLIKLTNKVADHYMAAKGYNSFWSFGEMVPAFEKYIPSRLEALERKKKAVLETAPAEMRAYIENSGKTADPNTTPEELLKNAKDQDAWQKYNTYKLAVDKFLEKDEGEKARSLLKAEPESKQKTDALNYLSQKQSENAIKDGKLDEAEKLIEAAETKSAKIQLIVDLAIGFEKKKTEEDHKTAVSLMEEASSLVNDVPESFEEATDIMKVAAGYSHIEPKRTYDYFDNLVYMSNDILTAQALLAKYNKRSNTFKDGEVIFTQIFKNSFSAYGESLGKLAEHDLGKTESLISLFQRQDIQIFAKLILAQSILKDKIGLEGNRPSFVVVSN